MGFIKFLAIFLAIYGGMHLYFFVKVEKAFPALRRIRPLTLPLVGLLVSAPFLARLADGAGRLPLALPLAWFSNIWMGLLFIFFWVAIVGELVFGILAWCNFWPRLKAQPRQRAGLQLLVALLIAVGLAAYGWQAANHIGLETISLSSAKLAAETGELRVVQVSDIHLGLMVGKDRLARIIARINQARPDILVCTGDIIEGHGESVEAEAAMLAAVRAPQGKFVVMGNHEFHGGGAAALAFFKAAGLTVLRGEARALAGNLTIAGVDDVRGHGGLGEGLVAEDELLGRLAGDSYIILLKHRPVPPADIAVLADLQLSGHGHQGQIFPFNLLVRLVHPYPAGLVELAAEKYLYTSRGSGTWGPPFRLGSPPEVTLFRIRALPGRAALEKNM